MDREFVEQRRVSKIVNINSTSCDFNISSSCKNYSYKDNTERSTLLYEGDTRYVNVNINNNVLQTTANCTQTYTQTFAVKNAVDKVIYDNASYVGARIIESGVSEYIVFDEQVFERIVSNNTLIWTKIQDEFKAELIKANLADKRFEATKN